MNTATTPGISRKGKKLLGWSLVIVLFCSFVGIPVYNKIKKELAETAQRVAMKEASRPAPLPRGTEALIVLKGTPTVAKVKQGRWSILQADSCFYTELLSRGVVVKEYMDTAQGEIIRIPANIPVDEIRFSLPDEAPVNRLVILLERF